jgi:hypothetical protein
LDALDSRENDKLVSLHLPFPEIHKDHKLQDHYLKDTQAPIEFQHQNLARVLNGGRARVVWRVVERTPTTSIADVLRRTTSLATEVPMAGAIGVLRGTGEALRYLHARGRVHGAVSSHRILSTLQGGFKITG